MKRVRDEDGYTLPELLLVVAMMGLLFTTVTGAMFVGLRTTFKTQSRLEESHDRQMVALYLGPDVLSAGNASGDVFVAGSGSNTDCSDRSNVLRLRWVESIPGSASVTFQAAYAVVQSGDEWQLRRYFCASNAGGSVKTTIVAMNLQDGNAVQASASGAKVSLAITDTSGVNYTVSGVRRTA